MTVGNPGLRRFLDRAHQRVAVERREHDAADLLAREALDDLHLLFPVVLADRRLPDDLDGHPLGRELGRRLLGADAHALPVLVGRTLGNDGNPESRGTPRLRLRPSAPAGRGRQRAAGRDRDNRPGRSHDALLPHPGEVDDHLDRLLHVLHRHPLEPRVEVVLAGEDVRRRQPHERQPRSVGAAADRVLERRRARAPHRLARAARRPRDADRAPPSCCGTTRRPAISTRRAGHAGHDLPRELPRAKVSFSFRPAVTKSRISSLTDVLSTPASTTYGCTKPSSPSVVSGDRRSAGRRWMKSAASLIALTIRPFA